jgi:hypothetical protein
MTTLDKIYLFALFFLFWLAFEATIIIVAIKRIRKFLSPKKQYEYKHIETLLIVYKIDVYQTRVIVFCLNRFFGYTIK